MLRRLLESFTATHVTILAALAILVPGALYAVPSFTNVAIEDIYTGARAAVTPNRRLFVYDPITGYRNNPANAVNITILNSGSQCETTQAYTPPIGKALVITAVSGNAVNFDARFPYTGYFLSTGPDCTAGTLLTSWLTQDAYAPVAVQFGNGIPVPAGQSIVIFSSNNNLGEMHIHGFLVPANAIPAPGTADAAYQGKPVGIGTVVARLAALGQRRR